MFASAAAVIVIADLTLLSQRRQIWPRLFFAMLRRSRVVWTLSLIERSAEKRYFVFPCLALRKLLIEWVTDDEEVLLLASNELEE